MILAIGSNINIIIAGRGINHTFVTRDREINRTFVTRGRKIKDTIVEIIQGVVVLFTVNIVIMVWVP